MEKINKKIKSTHILIAGEVLSSNLGDQVIAEMLKYLLLGYDENLVVNFLDISNRYPGLTKNKTNNPNPRKKNIPSFIKRFINLFRWLVNYQKNYQYLEGILGKADKIFIGGGQLLMDNHWDFPLKLYGITRLANKLGKEYHIVSCGVGKNWSLFAKLLVRRILAKSKSISVRDSQSKLFLMNHFFEKEIILSADPALWISSKMPLKKEDKKGIVGFGVIDLESANSKNNKKYKEQDILEFWLDLSREFLTKKIEFEFFCNGSENDFLFMRKIVRHVNQNLGSSIKFNKKPTSINELVEIINKFDLLISSRLHSHIISASYNIPSIALSWDKKVDAFFGDINQSQNVFTGFERKNIQIIINLIRSNKFSFDTTIIERKKMLVFSNLEKLLTQ